MKKFSILIGILIISVILLNGCGEKDSTPEKYNPFKKLDLEVGKTLNTSRIEVKLISEERKESYYNPNLNEMIKGNLEKIYIIIEAKIKNIHTETVFVGASEFLIVDSQNNIYKETDFFYAQENSIPYLIELEPDKHIKGKVLFEIPDSIENYKIKYDFIFSDI